MSIADSQNEIHSIKDFKQTSVTPMNRAAKTMADPSILIASMGLACLFAVNQGMRITTLAGIYPVEGSLILRHALAALMLVIVIFTSRQGNLPRFIGHTTGYAVLGALLCIALLARYSSILAVEPPRIIELVGKLAEESLCCLMIVIWANRILKGGAVRTTMTVAYGFLIQAALQLLLSLLQRVPCAVVLSLLPILSIGLYIAYSKKSSASKEEENGREIALHLLSDRKKALATMSIAAGIVFCLSFIFGGIIFESLDAQNAMADEPLSQLCIIIGNVIGAFILIFTAPHIRDRAYCTVFLMGCFACCAVSLYLTTFLVNEAVGGYLIASSIGLQGTLMFIWYAPFLVDGSAARIFRHFMSLYLAHLIAKTLSSACMLLHRTVFENIFSIFISLSLLGLFCCCVLLIIRTLDTGRTAEQPTTNKIASEPLEHQTPTPLKPANSESSSESEGQQHNPLHDRVEGLATEYKLTRQERRVLFLLAKGLNAGAISEKMVVSVNTTKSHMRSIYAKLNVHSQQEIIALTDEYDPDIQDDDVR